MNKQICILLCILLISLSVCPVFASDYYYSSISDFCNTINPLLGYSQHTYADNVFLSEVPSDLQTAFSATLSNFNLTTNDINFVAFQRSSSTYYIDIFKFSLDNTSGYFQNINSTVYPPFFYAYFPNNTCVVTRYSSRSTISNGTMSNYASNTSTVSYKQCSYVNNQGPNGFIGIVPYKLVCSPDDTFTDNYYLNYNDPNSGGGSSQGEYEYIEMDLPPNPYAYLWTQSMLLRWDELSAKWPNEFANMQRGEWPFDNNEQAELFAGLYNLGIIFETYASSNYAFYDNVSYNLATFMNSFNDLSDGLNKLVEIYASDQEVEAREAAAENQQAIVDNFLDSEGDGYVSPSNISSVSSMSDGYKTHMSTDAQPSGIWDIFNSNNFGWFSQETVNQLDTTTSNQRGLNTFETPYLDEKIKDIYNSLGVNYDD